jgi:apolipoprotein N-acyltransferase
MYRIFLGLLFLAELGLYLVTPDEPGLYSWKPQFIPFIVALPFLFVKSVRKPFNRFVYSYALISFAFLALDYLAGGHAGLIQISVLFIPFGLYLLFRFGVWNFKRLREKDSRTALLLSTIAWGAMALAFPPLPLGPAALLLLVPWFIAMNRYSRSSAIFATFW